MLFPIKNQGVRLSSDKTEAVLLSEKYRCVFIQALDAGHRLYFVQASSSIKIGEAKSVKIDGVVDIHHRSKTLSRWPCEGFLPERLPAQSTTVDGISQGDPIYFELSQDWFVGEVGHAVRVLNQPQLLSTRPLHGALAARYDSVSYDESKPIADQSRFLVEIAYEGGTRHCVFSEEMKILSVQTALEEENLVLLISAYPSKMAPVKDNCVTFFWWPILQKISVSRQKEDNFLFGMESIEVEFGAARAGSPFRFKLSKARNSRWGCPYDLKFDDLKFDDGRRDVQSAN